MSGSAATSAASSASEGRWRDEVGEDAHDDEGLDDADVDVLPQRVVRAGGRRRVSTFAQRVMHSQALAEPEPAAKTGMGAMSRMPSLDCPPPGSDEEALQKKLMLFEMFTLSNLGCKMSRHYAMQDDLLDMVHEVRHHMARILRIDLSPADALAREQWREAAKHRRARWWRAAFASVRNSGARSSRASASALASTNSLYVSTACAYRHGSGARQVGRRALAEKSRRNLGAISATSRLDELREVVRESWRDHPHGDQHPEVDHGSVMREETVLRRRNALVDVPPACDDAQRYVVAATAAAWYRRCQRACHCWSPPRLSMMRR